jgi:hypothetical protein
MGTDYDAENTGTYAITVFSYSGLRAPFGFPMNPAKWTIEVTDSTLRSQASPTDGTWYNLGSVNIIVPIGIWKVSYKAAVESEKATATAVTAHITLSTANNSESDANFTAAAEMVGVSATNRCFANCYVENIMVMAAKTTLYLNEGTMYIGTINTVWLRSDMVKTIVRATCVYL